MYMKNTVSKEMKLNKQPTHIKQPSLPTQQNTATSGNTVQNVVAKRATRTPHLHQLIANASSNTAATQIIADETTVTPRRGQQIQDGKTTSFLQNNEYQIMPPVSADRVRQRQQISEYSSVIKDILQNRSQIQKSQHLVSQDQTNGPIKYDQNCNTRASPYQNICIDTTENHQKSASVDRKLSYRAKEYTTSFTKSDVKQSFLADDIASPRAREGDNQLEQLFSNQQMRQQKSHRLTDNINENFKNPAVGADVGSEQTYIQPVTTKLMSFSEQRPYKQQTSSRSSGLKSSNNSKNSKNSKNSLYEQHYKIKQLQQQSQRKKQRIENNNAASSLQELKVMEDNFMQNQITPKRREDHAFTRPSNNGIVAAKSVQSRYHTQARSVPPAQPSPDIAQDFHMATEEGVDGAQAIENESDQTGEADANSPSPQYMESPPIKTSADTLMFQMAQKLGNVGLQQQQPLYNHENSSFGVQQHHLNAQPDLEDDSSAELAIHHKNVLLAEQDLLDSEEPRRGRAMRHQSYKNLFTKNSAISSGEQPSLIMEENSLLHTNNHNNYHLTQAQQQMLSGSHSQHNFQYLINNEDSQNLLQQCTDDDEIFDQDGGQDSNFVDVDDCSITADDQQKLLFQSSQQMQAAMMNFRRARPTNQPPLSSYGTWVQEPHIDEELSDAEQDNSNDSGPHCRGGTHQPFRDGYAVNAHDLLHAEDAVDEDGNSEDLIMLEDDDQTHHIRTASTAKDGRNGRVLRTENAVDDLDLFQEERTPEQTPQRSSKHCIPQFSSTQVLKTSEIKASSSKITKNMTQKNGSKNGFHTPVEAVGSRPSLSHQPPKISDSAIQTAQKKKSAAQASRQQRMKAQGVASMKVQKISSIDFSQPALQPKRSILYDENSNQDLSATLTKTLTKDGSRQTPRSQPITNFQLQQEQAKLIRHRQNFQSQKMNHTAFGSSLVAGKKGAGDGGASSKANKEQENPVPVIPVGINTSQSYSTFLNDKPCPKQEQLKKDLLSGSVIKDTKQHQPKSMVTKLTTSSCNLINYHNQVGLTSTKPASGVSKTVKQSQNQSRQHADNMKGGSSSSKKQTATGKTATQQNHNKNSSSIFITAKQSSSSVPGNKQIMGKNSTAVGQGIKPFSTEGHEPTEGKDSGSKSLSSASPEKRFQSRQNAQIAAISMTSSMVNSHHASTQGLTNAGISKTTQQKKEKSRCSAQMLPGTGSQSSSILNSHLRQLHNHQQSFTNLQSISSQFKDNVASRHQELKGNSGWNSHSTPVYPASTSKQASVSMNFAKPTVASTNGAVSSMSHSTVQQPLKSASIVKEAIPANGFSSHTGSRGTAKRGFFGRENGGGTAAQQSSVKASTAQLPTKEQASSDPSERDSKTSKTNHPRSSSKGKKKPAIKQPNVLKAKRSSITGSHLVQNNNVYLTTETSQNKGANTGTGGQKPQDNSASLIGSAGLARPPSSSKHTDQNPGQIFQGTKQRNRTNTTLGLQSNKHNSMRQSTNNLTLNELMAQQTLVHSKPIGSQKVSNRGTITEKQTSTGSFTTGASVSNFKSNSLMKSSTATAQKKNSNLISGSNPANRSAGISQINERVELMSSKVTASGAVKKSSGIGGIGGAHKAQKKDDLSATAKLRSQSTLKNQIIGAGPQAIKANSSLLNFTTQPSEQSKKRSNAQHSIIMAAVEGKSSQIQTSSRGAGQAVAGTRSITDSKRTSIAANASKEWGLADFEKAQYGDRCPKGYEKLSLLGKGGCAVVWLAREINTGRKVALKQFPKPRNGPGTLDPTAKIEIEMGKLLFQENSAHSGYSINPVEFPGILKIAKLYTVLEETKDVWLAYQVGGKCLTTHLFDVKGEFYKGERIYGVQHQDFYRALKEDKQVIVDLIRMLAEVLDVLAMFRIVHADIKPDNILIDFDGRRLRDVKLIDFGSAFSYENPSQISATTPEYLGPEVLDYLERRGQNTDSNGQNSTNLCRQQEPWSYDMWSMGAILLEMLTGIPLWMSLKCRAQTQTGKQLFGMGIFGVQGRQGKKILQKQSASLKNLQQTLKKYDCYQLDKDPVFMDLLVKMLDPNPITRISPIEVLEHPYIKDKHGTALESPN